MQQYDVQVEWQTVQHYLRNASALSGEAVSHLACPSVVLHQTVQQYANVVSCDVVSCDVVSPDLVLASVGLSRIRRSRCFRGCLACP